MKIKLLDLQDPNDDLFLTRGETTVGVMDKLSEAITSVKTINDTSLVGEGNITIQSDWTATSGTSMILHKPEIPTITSDDNGKVLGVVNGSWGLVPPSTLYAGTGTPSNSMGNNGDIYIQS